MYKLTRGKLKQWLVFLGFSICTCTSTSWAASVIMTHSSNEIGISGSATGRFDGTTTSDVVGNANIDYLANSDVALAFSDFDSFSGTPTSGTGTIDATISGDFIFGSATSNDLLSFAINATASALTAQNSAGENSDAIINVSLQANFFTDSSYSPLGSGALVGSMSIGGMPAIGMYEYLKFDVFRDGINVLSMLPGNGDGLLDIYNDSFYQIGLSYGMVVPYGIDPTGDYLITAEFSPVVVPVPPALFLFISGLGAFLLKAKLKG